ncbi:CUB and zona pellucida-like domain-containing protein 1 [Rana temporaria]|uniref:CUB and zona pellucida-like domain-containing protein 1 n=1 Tax=Rana temporaria TaxID=8407 RepID=UPI001AAD6900|nr:CUB and zona pellucida-like domain-containing protein 1 [Rana temporaria]
MSPVGSLIALLLLCTSSLAEEKAVQPEARCGSSFIDEYKPVQIQVAEGLDCTWDIVRTANETTRVIFSVLDLNPSADCSQENITVLDENLEQLGVLCPNSDRIAEFESSGTVYIRVTTNSEPRERNAYFFFYSLNLASALSCGGDLSGSSGTIASPNYPGRHDHFTYCIWNVKTPKNTIAKLSFTEIFIEPDASCRFDFIALFDGPNTDAPLKEVLCGRTVAELETSSNSFTLVFSADYANSYFGFSVDYTTIPIESNGSLSCSGDSMKVILDPVYITSLGYNANELTLIDKACAPNSDNPIVFDIPYTSCGTVKKVKDHTIYYTNTIFASTVGTITRRRQLQVIVTCELEKDSIAEIMYVTEDDIIQEQTEFGKYDVSLAFYPTEDFITPVQESPYFIELSESVFLQATVQSSDANLKVFVDTCFASPQADFQSPNYDLIRRGCVKDNTYHNYPSGSGHARFSFSAFKFLNSHTSVYLQCQLVICDSSDAGSRCQQGCVTRERRDLGSKVWKTNAVLGPLRLKRHSEPEAAGSVSEKTEEVKTGQSSLYVLGISVLVVNALILAFVVLRYTRRDTTGY